MNRIKKHGYGNAIISFCKGKRFVRTLTNIVRSGGGLQTANLPKPRTKFGKLTVQGFYVGQRGGVAGVKVKCDCESPAFIIRPGLANPKGTTQCKRCAISSVGRQRTKEYGYDKIKDPTLRKRLRIRVGKIIDRCTNPSSLVYANYGGRGIIVHEAWIADPSSMAVYLSSLRGARNPNNEIDRINNDLGYVPGNLRFVTKKQNIRNRRSIKKLQEYNNWLRKRIEEVKQEIANERNSNG